MVAHSLLVIDCRVVSLAKRHKMNDLVYEFQRMVSRHAEIKEMIRNEGTQTAWEKYSQAHGLNQQRFKGELGKLRLRFDGIGSGRDPRG